MRREATTSAATSALAGWLDFERIPFVMAESGASGPVPRGASLPPFRPGLAVVNEVHPRPLVTYDQSSPQLPLRSCDIGKVEQIGDANRLCATFCLAVIARPQFFHWD